MFGKKKRILVLEDEVALSKALCLKLEREGFSTIASVNGEEAIKETNSRKFDLMILDLVTPRVDGFGVLRHVRETDKETPIIVVSNLSQKEDMEEALSLGANKYLVKSNISLGEIVDEARDMLKE